MDTVAVLIRLASLGSATLVFGVLAFAWLVGGPALRALGTSACARVSPLRRQWQRSACGSGVAAMAAAILDLGRQATVVTEHGWGASLTVPIVTTVLTQTRYGTIWLTRQALLAGVVVTVWPRLTGRNGPGPARLAAAAVLAGASLAALAAAGHAASAPTWPPLAIVVDAAHLVATGAWLGGLLPFIRFLYWVESRGDREDLMAAATATQRFSGLGLTAMAILASSGAFNLWEHAPSVPALLGTPYGHWLSLKLAVWFLLLGLAAGSRWRFKPRLLALATTSETRVVRPFVQRLRRQLLAELTLGSALLGIVAVLNLSPPAHHVPPTWPLPFRLTGTIPQGSSGLPRLAVGSGLAGLGLLLALAVGVGRPRRGRWILGAGLVSVIIGAITGLSVVAVRASPTTYLRPATPYSATAIARGQALYRTHCDGCHDGDERGSVRLGRDPRLRVTVEPVLSGPDPTVGDRFWVVSHGVPGSRMPAFADRLAAGDRWAILHYLVARTAADHARTLGPELVAPSLAIPAPDFDYTTQRGESGALQDHRGHHSVLLVLFSLPGSLDRLALLDQVAPTLREAGLEILAVPLQPDRTRDRRARWPTLAIVTDGAVDVAATYRLFEGPPASPPTDGAPQPLVHMELLIDPDGALRARWIPNQESEGWTNPARLQAEALRAMEERAESPAAGEPHAH